MAYPQKGGRDQNDALGGAEHQEGVLIPLAAIIALIGITVTAAPAPNPAAVSPTARPRRGPKASTSQPPAGVSQVSSAMKMLNAH